MVATRSRVASKSRKPAAKSNASKTTLRPTIRKSKKFGYDAVDAKNRRKQPSGKLLCEDDELPADGRRKLISGTRDLQRNYAVAGWMIRKHLDFVSTMNFQARTEDQEFNAAWEKRMTWWSRKENCDASGRHPLRRIIRLTEALKTVLGDTFLIRMVDRKLFMLEGDRVRDPSQDIDLSQIVQGVRVDSRGMPLEYAVHNRKKGGGFEFDRMYSAENIIHHAWWDRADQTRGVSPIASALNDLQDVYEGKGYALAKMKVSQLFGLVLYRDAAKAPAPLEQRTDVEDVDEDEEEGDEEETAEPQYNIDFGTGPQLLDLNPGDKAEFLQNNTPSAEFREFMQVVIAIALKSLDIPFSMFDEAYTNFFGSKSAVMLYEKSCDNKREDLREVLRAITLWNLRWDVVDGHLTLPSGIETVEDCPFEWIAAGTPWWNPSQEVNADVAAVEGCLRTRTEIRKERYGDDWETNVVKVLAHEQKVMKDNDIQTTRPEPAIFNQPPIVVKDKDNAEK